MGKKIKIESNVLIKKPRQKKNILKPIVDNDYDKMVASSSCQNVSITIFCFIDISYVA